MRHRQLLFFVLILIAAAGQVRCSRAPTTPAPPVAYEIDAMVDNLKEVYYATSPYGDAQGMTATSDPEVLAEFRRVIHDSKRIRLNLYANAREGDVIHIDLASIWRLIIYNNNGNAMEIKTGLDDTWTYHDKSIPDWVELKNSEFQSLKEMLISKALELSDSDNSSQNQQ